MKFLAGINLSGLKILNFKFIHVDNRKIVIGKNKNLPRESLKLLKDKN